MVSSDVSNACDSNLPSKMAFLGTEQAVLKAVGSCLLPCGLRTGPQVLDCIPKALNAEAWILTSRQEMVHICCNNYPEGPLRKRLLSCIVRGDARLSYSTLSA